MYLRSLRWYVTGDPIETAPHFTVELVFLVFNNRWWIVICHWPEDEQIGRWESVHVIETCVLLEPQDKNLTGSDFVCSSRGVPARKA